MKTLFWLLKIVNCWPAKDQNEKKSFLEIVNQFGVKENQVELLQEESWSGVCTCCNFFEIEIRADVSNCVAKMPKIFYVEKGCDAAFSGLCRVFLVIVICSAQTWKCEKQDIISRNSHFCNFILLEGKRIGWVWMETQSSFVNFLAWEDSQVFLSLNMFLEVWHQHFSVLLSMSRQNTTPGGYGALDSCDMKNFKNSKKQFLQEGRRWMSQLWLWCATKVMVTMNSGLFYLLRVDL